jgi:hypothetical protein
MGKQKPIEKWIASDWINESSRIQRDPDKTSDAVLCGAMMLAAVREGTSIYRLAEALETQPARIETFHKSLRKNGVFTDEGKINANWFDEETGGTSFVLDVLVGLGMAGRAA